MFAALDAKYTKELKADAKAENDALRDDVALVVVGCTSKQSVSQCVKPPPPPAWIMQPPQLADTAEQGLHPQREADHYAKTGMEGTQKYINKAVQIGCPYRWATHANIVSNTRAGGYKCLK